LGEGAYARAFQVRGGAKPSVPAGRFMHHVPASPLLHLLLVDHQEGELIEIVPRATQPSLIEIREGFESAVVKTMENM
jgi:hypothetical protein